MDHPIRLILLNLSEPRLWLAEFLADLGYDTLQAGWGTSASTPLLVVSDQPFDARWTEHLSPSIDRMGWIALGSHLTRLKTRSPDIQLAESASGQEIATAVTLVGQLVAVRAAQHREREECQRWIRLAMSDPLTNLPNRRAWDERLALELAGRGPLAIGLLDLDLFKQVNDRSGHHTGDAVLRETGRILAGKLRRDDFVARLGGDEFGVILRHVNRPIASRIFERCCSIVSRHLVDANLPGTTLSAGFVVVGPDDSRVATEIFAAVSRALQSAKRADEVVCAPANSASTAFPRHRD